jgi:hypothetical protein
MMKLQVVIQSSYESPWRFTQMQRLELLLPLTVHHRKRADAFIELRESLSDKFTPNIRLEKVKDLLGWVPASCVSAPFFYLEVV